MSKSLTQLQEFLPGEVFGLYTFSQTTADLLVDVGHGRLALRLQRGGPRSRWRLADGLALIPLGDADGVEEVHAALLKRPTLARNLLAAAQHGTSPEYTPQLAAPFANPGTLSALIRATIAADEDGASSAAEAFVDSAGGRSWERRVALGMLLLLGSYQEALGHGLRLLSVASGHERVVLGAQLSAALRGLGEHEDADRMEQETADSAPERDAIPEPWNAQAKLLGEAPPDDLALARGLSLPPAALEDRLLTARRLVRDGEWTEAAWLLVRGWRQRSETAWQATMGECLIALGQPIRGLAYVENAQAAHPGWVGLHAVASRGLATIKHFEAARAQLEYAKAGAPGVFEGLGLELPADDQELEAFATALLSKGFLNRCSDFSSYRTSNGDVRVPPPISAVRGVLLGVTVDAEVFGEPEESWSS